MRREKHIFTLLFLLAFACTGYAQVRKSPRSSGFSVPRVSGNKARIMCPIFANSRYPYQGIGFKLGDPFALTYKFYANKHFSFAADVGKAATGLYNQYYREAFKTYLPDTLSKNQSIQYLAHKALSDLFVETKFLYQWDADKISKGLQLYAGVGWQWRNTVLEYDYNVSDSKSNANDGKFGKFQETRFTYGPVMVVGFEYSYFTLPVSAFIEIELFTDALLDPGYQRFQGGVGLRYVF
ncbi:MAG TPA: hypothetical protein PLR06_06405 [Cyclobacteriaceae bacterium]|nr:hypothetical protein [Cyclobacteriaceae bacterium]